MNILITGDSHLAAIDRALKSDSVLLQGHDIKILPLGNAEATHNPYFADGENCIEITLDRLQLHLSSLPPKGFVPDVIAVSMLFHTLRFLRQTRLWSSFAPASLEFDDRHALSRSVLRRMVLCQQQYNLELMRKLKKYVPRVFALEGPRVFSHHTAFKKNEGQVLLEVDNQYRQTMHEELSKLKIEVIDCPSEAFCRETGLMKPKFRTGRADDLHHANTEFGGLVLRDMLRAISVNTPSLVDI